MFFYWIDEVLFTWGLPLLLLGVGGVYLIALRAFPYLHPLRTLRLGFGGNFRSALRALSLALGGTLGVGNITGVALALAAGGAGALLWMWISAAVAVFLKYGEIVLALLTRKRGTDGVYEGGAMYYLRGRGGRLGRLLSALFAFLCFLCALTLGAPVQSNTAAEAGREVLGIPPLLTGLVMLAFTALAVFGGVRKIAAFTERIIPVMSGIYLLLSAYAVLTHVSYLPSVLSRVFREALSFSSGVAGTGGFLVTRAVRYGVTRGLLSNEAGAGTAPMAHAVAENAPCAQGVMGILEVAIDTFVFCTATALPLLIAYPHGFPDLSGIGLVVEAFCLLTGPFAAPVLCLSLFLFAYATVLAWCYYGRRAIGYLTQSAWAERAYLYLYVFLVGMGSYLAEGVLWYITDGIISLLTMLHTACLLPLLPIVIRESRREGLLGKRVLCGNGKAEARKGIRHVRGQGGKDRQGAPVRRMGKRKTRRVQRGAGEAVTLPPIEAVAANGMTDGAEV